MPPKADHLSRRPESPGAGATLDQWLSYLEAIHPAEIDLGLDRVLMVLRRLFPRKPKARIITVAGTNGKGSAVACLEALLLAAGRTTGAYTSPHLQRYNERVRVNGKDIGDEELIAAFAEVEAARKSVTLTYFESGTLAAFVLLARAGVEDWILEVGLGGRLDAVNVLDPDLAIITSVDIDHVAFLGNDRETIGFEKAGILRPGIPAIYADIDPPRSVLQQVAAQRVALQRLDETYYVDNTGSEVVLRFRGSDLALSLPTVPLPVNSVAAAVAAFRELEPDRPLDSVAGVIARVRAPGRFEKLASHPAVYADVGHNPHAARWLAARLESMKSPAARLLAVYGALSDKDVEGVVQAMSPVVDQWYLGGLDCPRGLPVEALGERVASAGSGLDIIECTTVSGALQAALESANPDDLIIAFGSFFTVAEIRRFREVE
ncbi:bifunctional tetrahydrofolate synthase/dihydrofolate synthase [Marinobacter sp. NP-4(2019)]|uniref:bifunctional tetrahydrofolate synthase/dihydrofolate synthase n=1 Tax=Marinobacter sp. NP-4(2019) TaxID=2488665 RepID=UPI000FC3DAA8|nr:bifunctional tetrahydrofolate synthase/dihydrofolate synthase [Marinobacter sp. NP-4(2019)]AZT84032.1 bifunctional tetrahydrofolate synthase/dihydrofolate synthase [Marinobacter sp. NP-4(2019)]